MLQKTIVGKRDTGIPGKTLPRAGVTEVSALAQRDAVLESGVGCYAVLETLFKDAAELTQACFFFYVDPLVIRIQSPRLASVPTPTALYVGQTGRQSQ